MYRRVGSCIILILFSFINDNIFPEGFAPDTLVRFGKKHGWQTIAQAVVMSKRFIFKDPVLSFNVSSGRWQAKKIRRGAIIDTDYYIKLCFNGHNDCDITCALDQRFYVVPAKKWVYAYQLKINDYLLAEGNRWVQLSNIELVKEPMRMYSINVKHNNTFVVGKHKVLAHNMDIALAPSGAQVLCSAVAGIAGLILEISEGVLLLSGPVTGPVGVAAAAGIGYIAGTLLTNAVSGDKKHSHYKTTSRIGKIDATIARMKQETAGNVHLSGESISPCRSASATEQNYGKPLWGCGTGENWPKKIPQPGPCVTGLDDELKRGVGSCGLNMPKLPEYGCGTDARGVPDITATACNYSKQRGFPSAGSNADIPTQTDDGFHMSPDEDLAGIESIHRAAGGDIVFFNETLPEKENIVDPIVDDAFGGVILPAVEGVQTQLDWSESAISMQSEGAAAIIPEIVGEVTSGIIEVENIVTIIDDQTSAKDKIAFIEKGAQWVIVQEGKRPIEISKEEQEGFCTKHKYRVIEKTREVCRIVRPKDAVAAVDWGKEKYKAIRESTDDIEKISKNTGISVEQIKRIKEHLFYDEHILDDGIRQFDADAEIAAAWDRLCHGDYIANDIHLLEHELFESMYEKTYNTDYRTAHNAAEDSGREWDYPFKE